MRKKIVKGDTKMLMVVDFGFWNRMWGAFFFFSPFPMFKM